MIRLTREYMIDKLLQWNPHWSRATVQGWHYRQLCAVYAKERRKVVERLSRPQLEAAGQLRFPW